MPKAPMAETEIFKKKERILDIAAEIIMEEGYHSLSMRKIGTKIGMTAANLYNYYSNKDELNIAIRTRAGSSFVTARFPRVWRPSVENVFTRSRESVMRARRS